MDKHTFEYEDDSGRVRTWNVYRLWKLAKALPVEERSMQDFQDKVDLWLRFTADKKGGKTIVYLDVDHFYRIREADLDYPVILNASGTFIMDGMHRLMKAWLSGAKTIKVVQFPADPTPDKITGSAKHGSAGW